MSTHPRPRHRSIPPLEWVRPPQQERSQRTLERLLDAAQECIVAEGVQSLTVSAVVARARSSVGAFYARFPDKMALLSTLHERECAEARATTDVALDPSRWQDVELSDALEQIVSFVVQLFVGRRRLVLAFIGIGATDQGFAERRAHLTRHIAEKLRVLLLERADEIPHPDLAVAADVAVRIILGTLESEIALLSAVQRDHAVTPDRLSAELTRALLGYFGIPVSLRMPGHRARGD